MTLEERRAAWNTRARARLEASGPELLPRAVLAHALASSWIPRTNRAAVDACWRAHPIRAERLCRRLASRSGAPPKWRWAIGDQDGLPASFRVPPLPYRERAHRAGPGQCIVCGQTIFRLGWHADYWGSGEPNRRAEWHACCVVAWNFWIAPGNHRKLLSKLQGRKCGLSERRLLRTAEVDHRTPLHQVWRDYRDRPWPELLAFWGMPNLQVVNSTVHTLKSVEEARTRAKARSGQRSDEDQSVIL
jgi:hypothetical protein